MNLSEERTGGGWEEMRVGKFELKASRMNVMGKVRPNCEYDARSDEMRRQGVVREQMVDK